MCIVIAPTDQCMSIIQPHSGERCEKTNDLLTKFAGGSFAYLAVLGETVHTVNVRLGCRSHICNKHLQRSSN